MLSRVEHEKIFITFLLVVGNPQHYCIKLEILMYMCTYIFFKEKKNGVNCECQMK